MAGFLHFRVFANQGTLYAGYEQYRCKNFHETFSYADMPQFYRGYNVYDWEKVGFVSAVAEEKGRRYFKRNTAIPGNSNKGHEGAL